MATKMCMKCGLSNKAPGKQRCTECLLLEQPALAQEQAARVRLAMIPEELRLDRVPKELWPRARRWCSGCQSFRRLADCTGSRCQVCQSLAAWEAMLPRTYTIHDRPFTADDYWALYKDQGGVCKICERRSLSRRLAVDHDHDTMQVRGLLCPDPEWGCNYAILGKIKDVNMAYRIFTYLDHNYAMDVVDK